MTGRDRLHGTRDETTVGEHSRLRLHRSFTATLMLLVLLLLLAFSLIWGFGFVFAWSAATIEEVQRSESGLAQDLARELQPYFTIEGGRRVTSQEVARRAYEYQQVHRNVGIYLLDSNGRIVWNLGEGEPAGADFVELDPIKRFLAGEELPIYGTNPGGKRDSAFSAARIDLFGSPGYLYLTLINKRREAWTNFLLVNTSIRMFLLLTFAVALIVGIIGALAVYFVTRRFRDVADVLRRYRGGDFSKRLDASGHDELAEVSDAVNSMLDTVEDQLDQLRRKDHIRRELIANIWHDLKTPVTAIRAHLELLEGRSSDLDAGERHEMIGILRASTSMLQSMLTDLYDLGRFEAREIEPHIAPCELVELCDEIVAMFKERSREAQVALSVDCDIDYTGCRCDPDLIGRVLANLLDNAIRHTPAGGKVTIGLDSAGTLLAVRVTDTGHGIPQSSLPFLFDRFFQIEGAGTRKKGSAGLGLAIVKRILEAHGTDITVESTVNSGTTFSFMLPAIVDGDLVAASP